VTEGVVNLPHTISKLLLLVQHYFLTRAE
jgi:hypothetical protein